MRRACALLLLTASAALLPAQAEKKERPLYPPDKATQRTIQDRLDKLGRALDGLRRQGVQEPTFAEVEIYHKAVTYVLEFREFFDKQSPDWALAVLDRGLLRASQAGRGESPWLNQTGQSVVRAYRSRLDGSVQPYAVVYPRGYGAVKGRRYRLDVVLHGRDKKLTEVSFLNRHAGDKVEKEGPGYVRLEVYGRGNNAYRWAGEVDVFEALGHFLNVEAMVGRGALIDQDRIVLRGFSMGGAGTWHLGLHRPHSWRVIGPGAGFTTTRGYVARLPEKLPDHIEKCLKIYDAVEYAENASQVRVVAYSGEDDAQIAAALNIEKRLEKTGISITHLRAPRTGHTIPPEWRKKLEAAYAKYVAEERPEYRKHVRFVTWTLKYPTCFWVDLLSLEKHYERTAIDAERTADGFAVKTTNVRSVQLRLESAATREALTVVIDGQKLEGVTPSTTRGGDLAVFLAKSAGRWSAVLPERLLVERLRQPRKCNNLQGPIDDAFMAPFLCVLGTRDGWHEKPNVHARASLARFQAEWAKYFRGQLPVKNDVDVTPDDIASRHLVLFGDPASNRLIEQVLPGLPLGWTAREVRFGGTSYAAESHLPVLIYPSPLATDRYVVLNSGHTFRAADFEGTNALLFPRLGDYAILRTMPTKEDVLAAAVVTAGLFEDDWRVPGRIPPK